MVIITRILKGLYEGWDQRLCLMSFESEGTKQIEFCLVKHFISLGKIMGF